MPHPPPDLARTAVLPAVRVAAVPPPRSAHRFMSPALAVLAMALLPVAAATTDLTALDGWGLAAVLGPAAWGALLCAVLACLTELAARRPRVPALAAATGVLILCSTGLPAVLEPAARFGTAWTTAGFVDALVVQDGVPPRELDTRFWWPAFFAQWAWFREAGGVDQLDTVLRWYPPLIVAVWATGIFALARSVLGGTRAPWVAAWLFVGLDWIEQDYFSPQSEAIVLLLTVLTFVLGPLATRRVDPAGVPGWPAPQPGAPRLPLPRRWLVAAMTPPNRPTLPPRQLLFVYFCLTLCALATVVGHQLTPIALCGQLALLAVVGRFRGRGMLLVAVVGLAVFLLVGNRGWWLGQFGVLVGTGAGESLQAGVADRAGAGDTGQQVVKQLRIVLAGLTYALGAAGVLTYWRRRRDLVPFGLAVIPMAMVVQGYGSEAFLRVLLYGLPVLAVLGTDALRALVRRRRHAEVGLALGMVAMFGTLVLVRGGNEAYQVVFPEEVALYRQVVAATPPGLEIMALNRSGPTGVVGVTTHGRGDGVPGCGQLTDDPIRCIDLEQPDVLVSFTSVEKQGVHLDGRPAGWSRELIVELVASGRYVLTYQDGFNAALVRVQ